MKRPARVTPLAGDMAQVSFLLGPYLNPVKVVWGLLCFSSKEANSKSEFDLGKELMFT